MLFPPSFVYLTLLLLALICFWVSVKSCQGRIFFSVVFIAFSSFVYWQLGQYSKITIAHQQQLHDLKIQATIEALKTPQNVVKKLKEKLLKNPNSAQGWYLLGRLEASLGNFDAAYQAFYKAHMLSSKHFAALSNLAQLELQKQNFLDTKTEAKLKHYLNRHVKSKDALALLAIHAFNRQDYGGAIEYWERLMALVLPNSSDARTITEAIARARDLKAMNNRISLKENQNEKVS